SEALGIHRRFQANTIKNRKVLSYFTLGKRVFKNIKIKITMLSWRITVKMFYQKIKVAQELRI
ncbi:hypothetical protein L4C32_19485, partial [Aliivibrio kagoshimensis]